MEPEVEQCCEVINKYHEKGKPRLGNVVYIGRGSKWGNPFVLNVDGDRDKVCDMYEEYFWTTDLVNHLDELFGMRLECYCHPKRCHGDFLAKLANQCQSTGVIPTKDSMR